MVSGNGVKKAVLLKKDNLHPEIIVRALIKNQNKILLCKSVTGKHAYLPGGHVEVGETPEEALAREIMEELGVTIEIQKKIGVLETGLVTPVGSEKPMKVSVRLICATHQDIKYLVAEKKFREDLFFRLWTLPLSVPSLQERKNDIPYLAKHFAALKGKNMESKLLKILSSHPWPGNIRELKNTIFHLAALSEEENIASSHWHQREAQGGFKLTDLKKIEKKQIISVLSHFKWNKSKVAESLGLSRTSLYRKIKQYNVYSEERLKK